MSITKKKEKIQVDKNRREYILFRNDVYFTKYLLAVEVDERKHAGRDVFFEEKDKKHKKKCLLVDLLEFIQVSVIMKIIKLVEYKHLLVNIKTDN